MSATPPTTAQGDRERAEEFVANLGLPLLGALPGGKYEDSRYVVSVLALIRIAREAGERAGAEAMRERAASAIEVEPLEDAERKLADVLAARIRALTAPAAGTKEEIVTDDQIKYMVNRFLAWRLPKDFNPDAGISFKPDFNQGTSRHEPSGTNLFDATQAEAMVRYMIDGMPRHG